MISPAYLEKQVRLSKKAGRITPFLAQLVFQVVDESLRAHYGDNYSDRCAQASLAISHLLETLGIRSRVFAGAVCVPSVSPTEPFTAAWTGFWDADHHIWVITEFEEIVDLTILQLHLHPATTRAHEPLPAFWWDTRDGMPSVLRYLPNGVMKPDFPADDMAVYERFIEDVASRWKHTLETTSRDKVKFGPILHNIDSLNRLFRAGHPWATKASAFQVNAIPLPPWIVAREQELMSEIERVRASS